MQTRRSTVAQRVLGRIGAIALAVAISVGATGLPQQAAAVERAVSALSGSQFDPGNIISDDQFYQSGAMSEAEIQAFLDAKIGTCANSNCLNVLYASTESRAYDRGICTGFTPDGDAIERASAIIYKVQQSCSISAKVILVNLQKEQGLVTHKGPTSGRLGAAMGWLCPDTAPCDSGGASFFRQVYGGAWQFKRYNTPNLVGNYHIGTYQLLYNPNRECGTKTVTIKNHATAALYNYTPYTPNDASLANLYGTAPCGAYGNRNFWVYYNSWFGNPTTGDGLAHVAEKYAAVGGAAGPLGTATGAGSCTRSVYSCYQNYQHGVIYWSTSLGAFAVTGEFGDYYLAKGGVAGPLGPPSSDFYTVTDPNGNGFTQGFATGMIYQGPPGRFAIIGAAQSAYTQAGWLRGSLGWPTSEQSCATGLCIQTVQRGTLYQAGSSFAAMDATLDAVYRAAGGPSGPFGKPVSAVTVVEAGANGDGRTVGLTGGMLYNSAAGTYLVPSRFQSVFAAAGWVRGSMGWPIENPVCTLPGEGCRLGFQHGDIYAPKTGAAYAVSDPAMAAAYRTAGGPAGSLGWPVSATTAIDGGANGAGKTQGFTNGMIYLRGGTAVTLDARLQKSYVAGGWVRGPLGWPTAPATCTLPGGGCRLDFQNGAMYQPATGNGFAITNSQIANAYVASGGPSGPLGWPISLTTSITTAGNGDGYTQGFNGGMIYSSAQGTFTLTPVSQKGFIDAGWVRGPLGWPAAAPNCDSTGCAQRFQGGNLYIPTGGTAFGISDSRIAAYYDSHGGFAGPIGFPTTATTFVLAGANGSGYVQGFRGGYIYASALGTYSIMGVMQSKFIAEGWLRGRLGFPIADAVCSTTCTQAFRNGTLTAP